MDAFPQPSKRCSPGFADIAMITRHRLAEANSKRNLSRRQRMLGMYGSNVPSHTLPKNIYLRWHSLVSFLNESIKYCIFALSVRICMIHSVFCYGPLSRAVHTLFKFAFGTPSLLGPLYSAFARVMSYEPLKFRMR